MNKSIPASSFSWLALILVAMAACGGEKDTTGPFTGVDGRVTFVPLPGVTVRGSTLRKEELDTPSDSREIAGSGFWFDPGEVSIPESMPGEYRAGTLFVSYDGLTLPPGVAETSLRIAEWTGDYWTVLYSAPINLEKKTLQTEVSAERAGNWYAVVSPRGMSVRIEEGLMGNFAGDSLFVMVTTSSDVPIATVTAAVGDRSTTVVPESPFSQYHRVGWISLVGLPRGKYVARATATRTDGLAVTDTLAFAKDYQPVVTLVEPAPYATVGQRLRVRATCTDDDPGGCKSLRILASHEASGTMTVIASGTSSIDREIGLGGLAGRVWLVVDGIDQAGQRVTHSVPVTAQ